MMTATAGVSSLLPEAYISVGRNRQKIYPNNKIYLQDGVEFSIELFNPTGRTVGAKIYINGEPISNRLIVVKPGRREYLERFIDSNKKLVFETYDVDGKDADALRAIANNGFVKIEYFDEQVVSPPYWGSISTGSLYVNGNPLTTITTTENVFFTQTFSTSSDGALFEKCKCTTDSLETGRVEGGDTSNQDFSNYYGNFSMWPCSTSEYQILPVSHKPVEISKVRQYCTGCGNRVRKVTWKFCPSCGEKLD